MVKVHSITIDPPLINSSCAWASDYKQLRELYDCPYTGAVTTRTATLDGFAETEVHTVVFTNSSITTLNSYGYSPHPLSDYIKWVYTLLTTPGPSGELPTKPIIISITASVPAVLEQIVNIIQNLRAKLRVVSSTQTESTLDLSTLVAIELNTSCPNIKNAPPPAYNLPTLLPFLDVLSAAFIIDTSLTIGLKLPPYLYNTSFQDVVTTLATYSCDIGERLNPFAYIACTNTLGSSVLFTDQVISTQNTVQSISLALPTLIGGLGGESLHPLALGNVLNFSSLLASCSDPAVSNIVVFGIGGVTTPEAVQRMRFAGAKIVGCATILGSIGVSIFKSLSAVI